MVKAIMVLQDRAVIRRDGEFPFYSIKRDLRENTGFKLIIGRVGPLFQALDAKDQQGKD